MRHIGRVTAIIVAALLSIAVVLLPGAYLDDALVQAAILLDSIEGAGAQPALAVSAQHGETPAMNMSNPASH